MERERDRERERVRERLSLQGLGLCPPHCASCRGDADGYTVSGDGVTGGSSLSSSGQMYGAAGDNLSSLSDPGPVTYYLSHHITSLPDHSLQGDRRNLPCPGRS